MNARVTKVYDTVPRSTPRRLPTVAPILRAVVTMSLTAACLTACSTTGGKGAPSADSARAEALVDSLRKTADAAAATRNAGAASSSSLMLERGRCRGGCTPYRVTLLDDGHVTFAHLDGAAVQQDSIAPASVLALMNAMRDGGFVTLDSALVQGASGCGAYAADAPTAVLTLTTGTSSHTVRHDYGCASLPASLRQWGAAVDSIAKTARWLTPSTGASR